MSRTEVVAVSLDRFVQMTSYDEAAEAKPYLRRTPGGGWLGPGHVVHPDLCRLSDEASKSVLRNARRKLRMLRRGESVDTFD